MSIALQNQVMKAGPILRCYPTPYDTTNALAANIRLRNPPATLLAESLLDCPRFYSFTVISHTRKMPEYFPLLDPSAPFAGSGQERGPINSDVEAIDSRAPAQSPDTVHSQWLSHPSALEMLPNAALPRLPTNQETL